MREEERRDMNLESMTIGMEMDKKRTEKNKQSKGRKQYFSKYKWLHPPQVHDISSGWRLCHVSGEPAGRHDRLWFPLFPCYVKHLTHARVPRLLMPLCIPWFQVSSPPPPRSPSSSLGGLNGASSCTFLLWQVPPTLMYIMWWWACKSAEY